MKNDLAGKRFGRLVVLKRLNNERTKSGVIPWLCICDCGNETKAEASKLKSGNKSSCGCFMSESRNKNIKKFNELDKVGNTKASLLKPDRIQKNNTSGYKGVHWDKKTMKWHARINIEKKRYNLGFFENKQDAINARKEAEEEYFKPILEKHEQKTHSHREEVNK